MGLIIYIEDLEAEGLCVILEDDEGISFSVDCGCGGDHHRRPLSERWPYRS